MDEKVARMLETLVDICSEKDLYGCLNVLEQKIGNGQTTFTEDAYTVDFMEVAEVLNDGCLVISPEGVILKSNEKFHSLTGFERDELMGHNINEFVEKGYFDKSFVNGLVYDRKTQHTSSDKLVKDRMHLITGIPFLTEDKNNLRGITITIRDTTEQAQQQMELEELKRKIERTDGELEQMKRLYTKTEIIGDAPAMRRLEETILSVAGREVAVLISGETGCGKEVIASAIQKNSSRSDKPYIKVNCAAIPGQLMESELFGYEEGAFTGAKSKGKPGMFELADGGTILLDEIGDLPLELQPKLLRVLQEKELVRLGGTKVIPIDVRVISATNQNLLQLCKEKKFREDLYYRLNVVPIKVPPLRERKSDILLLANHFLERYNAKYGQSAFLTFPAISELEHYDWPGNVRELENVMERLVVMSDGGMIRGEIIREVLQGEAVSKSVVSAVRFDEAVFNLEYSLIHNALQEHGSTYKAADALGITQSRIVRKMKSLGIQSSNERLF